MLTLNQAKECQEYIIKGINTDDEEMEAFLFTLGCYSGEPITVVSRKKDNLVVSIKDARYNIDSLLAEAITIKFYIIKKNNDHLDEDYKLSL